MPKRKEILTTGEYYHIYNRGVEKRPIYESVRGYQRFKDMIHFYIRDHDYQFSKLTIEERNEIIQKQKGEALIEIVCYILMPNHYHLLLKQGMEKGISRYIQTVANGYAKYFNTRHERVGPLFQGKFQAVRLEDDAQLLHLSRYIHLNPVIAGLVVKPEDYPWSSYLEYLEQTNGFCKKDIVLGHFKKQGSYQEFVEDYSDYKKRIPKLQHLLIER